MKAVETIVRSWCEHCQIATPSIRIRRFGKGHIFVCALCKNP